MTKQEIIDYMYDNHVQGDFKIEEMAEDLAQPQWISVSERLPEKEGYYLIWLDDGFFEVVHYWNGYWNAFSHCTKNSLEGVIAWMPTPGPYKEEKNGRV